MSNQDEDKEKAKRFKIYKSENSDEFDIFNIRELLNAIKENKINYNGWYKKWYFITILIILITIIIF